MDGGAATVVVGVVACDDPPQPARAPAAIAIGSKRRTARIVEGGSSYSSIEIEPAGRSRGFERRTSTNAAAVGDQSLRA